MKMPTVNFDEHFAAFTSEWMKEHRQEYRTFDDMEEDIPRIYMAFLNTRASWLGSVTPGSYFTQFEDPKVLVDWMNQYCTEGIPIPEPLMEQIVFVGKPCEKRLVELLKDDESSDEAKMTAVGLLRDLDSVQPKMLYIGWQLDRNDEDDLKDNALESLIGMGESVVQPILQQIGNANEAGKEALLEVLSHFPGNEQIFRLMMDAFMNQPQKQALFAGYLAKLDVPYLTFIEIRNAIETLGGECPEREYEDDPEYEALRGLDQT